MSTTVRGFPEAEFKTRTDKAQALMADAGLAALLLTTEPEIRYFTGFLTRFWESPTRPWFLVVPSIGKPIAVIPSIGAHLMSQTWIDDIRTWSSPDLEDDGVSLLGDTLREVAQGGEIGQSVGPETHLRMPLSNFETLKASGLRFSHDHGIIRRLRMVKSAQEISKITKACQIAGRAFSRVGEIAKPGTPFSELFRRFQILCLDEGADDVRYLAGGHGPMGYGDVISPATDAPINTGDVVMLDTGITYDGYFCDFDRNFAIAHADQPAIDAYKKLIEATDAGMAAAKPGITAADLYHAMDAVLTGGKGGGATGRLGHGLGMQLTEWPSLTPQDQTALEVGMVLTLEPFVETAPGLGLVHEENIVITDTGAQMISPAAPRDLQVLK